MQPCTRPPIPAPKAEPRACGVRVTGHIVGPVICDRELVRRAVDNVLRNAIRFSPPGGGIDVEVRQQPPWVSVAVRDHGPGVRDSYRGVGLGLSIARRAVALHGGRVTARNATPGLTVTIELPQSRSNL